MIKISDSFLHITSNHNKWFYFLANNFGRIVNEAEHPVGINRLGEIENIKFDIDKKLIYNINNKKQLKGVFNYVIQTF